MRTYNPLSGVASAQGLDVSNFQGRFDWAGTSGLSFGVFRLTQGLPGDGVNSPDPDAAWNHAQIAAAKINRGAYHFLDPAEDGAAQARFFSAQYTALGLGGKDMMWLDNETAGRQSAAEVSACARAFMAELKFLHPHQPMGVYTFIDFASAGFCSGLGSYPLWLAHPAATSPVPPPPWSNWMFWQWGIRNGDDADAFNGTGAGLTEWLASFAAPKPVPAPAPKPAPKPAPSAVPSQRIADGRLSLADLARDACLEPLDVVWLTARNLPQPGPAHLSYLNGIIAGKVKYTAPMPAGMKVWA